MKKLLGIVVLSLSFCNLGYSEILHLKCELKEIINYSPFKGKLIDSENKLTPMEEHVYSIDLSKEAIIGYNYEIWKNRPPKPHIHIFEDQIILVEIGMWDEKVASAIIKPFWEQTAFSFYHYIEINRINGNIEISKYSQNIELANQLNNKYISYININDSLKKKLKGLEFIYKINKIADNSAENKEQRNNIIMLKKSGACEKLEKLKQKF